MTIRTALGYVGAAALGAALMYELDPDRGRRRRAIARDRLRRLAHEEREFLDKGIRDLSHRVDGAYERLRPARSGAATDEVIVARVRAALGRAVRHPAAIDVEVAGGTAILRGHVLAREADRLRRRLARVPGVERLVDRLERHQSADRVPALQGAGRAPRSALRRENWPPAWRLGAGAMAAGALVEGARRRGAGGAAIAAGGGALLIRALSNRSVLEILGLTGDRTRVIQRTMLIRAPIDEVYRVWTDVESFPRFMDNVRVVKRRRKDPGRAHWEVRGPLGLTAVWEAELTADVPREVLAWRTLPGSTVQHAGIVRFEAASAEETRVHLEISLRRIGGLIGEVMGKALGADPARRIDADLIRLKTLLEEGRTRAHGHRISRADLPGAF